MRKEECFYLGKIAKKFSFKGEVLIYLDTDEPEQYEELESVFIENSSIHKGDFLRVKFEDIDSEQDADELIGSHIYLPLSMLPKLEGNKFYFHEVIGFDVVDKRLGNIGKIVSINDSTSQPLFEILFNEKEILIPMIDHFIIEVNRKEKKIILNTTEGLVDLYL